MTHGLPDMIVVSTHIGRVFLTVGTAVKEDDWDATVVGFVERGGEMAG